MKTILLVLEAYVRLIIHDLRMRSCTVQQMCKSLPPQPQHSIQDADITLQIVCRSLDLALVFYPKVVLCLQRSAVLVTMLRVRNLEARLIVAVQQSPFRAHAWVEHRGQVVHDDPAMTEGFSVLEVNG